MTSLLDLNGSTVQKRKPGRPKSPDGLTPSARKVLRLILQIEHEEGVCSLSKTEIAKRIDICTNSCDSAIRLLAKKGIIEIVPRFGNNNAQLSNIYRINKDEMVKQGILEAI